MKLLLSFFLTIFTFIGFCQTIDSVQLSSDSIKIVTDTTAVSSTNEEKVRESNDVETTVNYSAKDSIFMDVFTRKAYLYGDAHVDYGDITLDAAYIEIDWNKSEVYAKGLPDSTGEVVGIPVFKQGEDIYTTKEMRYNYETGKGIIHNVVTQEGEGYVQGETIKMNAKDELFAGDAIYTTCNLEHPHFAIHSKRIKIIPDKLAVTGPFNLTIADVPTPLGFLFGVFPFPKDKSSGIIIPSYGESASRGFFLQEGGFYWAINDYVGSKVVGDIYTNGSWRVNWETDYKKKYAFDGRAIIALTDNKTGFDKIENKAPLGYRFYWKHTPKISGNSSITSSVDIKSANYNRDNSYNIDRGLGNSFRSSITYRKKFGKSPFDLTVALGQSQTDSVQDYTLPDVTFNMNRISPFKSLGSDPKAWYSQFGIAYILTGRNRVSNLEKFYKINGNFERQEVQTIDFLEGNELLEKSRNGIKHSLPITLPKFKLLKYINVAPNVSYNEYWYGKEVQYGGFVDTLNAPLRDTINKFSRAYDYDYRVSMTSRIFGYFEVHQLGLERIKHTMSPTVGFTYNPDFSDERFGFYDTYIDTNNREQRYSKFEGDQFVMGAPSRGESRVINFSISNILEAKVRSKKDTVSGFKYFKLLENFSVSSSYNLAADSNKLLPLQMRGRTTIKGVNIQFNGNYDFYEYDSLGNNSNKELRRTRDYIWKVDRKNFKIGRLTNFGVSVSTNLNPKKRKDKHETDKPEEEEEVNYINNNINDYVDFNIPWSLRIGYNLNMRRPFSEATTTQSITVSGDLSLTPKWKVNWNSGYDIMSKEMTPTSVGIIRDLHCWEMRFQWIPFGIQRSYTFDINVKASILQDLKLSKKDRSFDR